MRWSASTGWSSSHPPRPTRGSSSSARPSRSGTAPWTSSVWRSRWSRPSYGWRRPEPTRSRTTRASSGSKRAVSVPACPAPAAPAALGALGGDVVVFLSAQPTMSFAWPLEGASRHFVAVPREPGGRLQRAGSTRNVIAHELGHTLGLAPPARSRGVDVWPLPSEPGDAGRAGVPAADRLGSPAPAGDLCWSALEGASGFRLRHART